VTNPSQVRDESVDVDKISKDKRREDKVREDKKRKEDLFETLLPSYQISEPLADKIREFMRYRKEQHRFTYRETGLKSFLRGAEKAEQEHGSIAVIKCFDETMRNGWQGVFYDKIKKEEAKESSLKDILKEKYARRGNEEV
jgi:5'-deoxynucleotidase YfbR-like HD superfamily hydrolase